MGGTTNPESSWESQTRWDVEGVKELCSFRNRVRDLCCQGQIALQLPAHCPGFRAVQPASATAEGCAAFVIFQTSSCKLQQQRVSISRNCAGLQGSVTLSTVPSLLGKGPGKTDGTTAGTSINYMRRSNLLLKDRKDSGKSVISGISYGKLGSSG